MLPEIIIAIVLSVFILSFSLIWWIGAFNMLRRFTFRADNAYLQLNQQFELLKGKIKTFNDAINNIDKTKKIENSKISSHCQAVLDENLNLTFSLVIDRNLIKIINTLEQYNDVIDLNVYELKNDLITIEHKIFFDAYAYNDVVDIYNPMVNNYMTKLVALTHGFKLKKTINLPE